MLVLKRIGLLILVLGLLMTVATGLRSHGLWHDAKKPYLEFTSEANISCNIEGKRFTHTRVVRDGEVIVDFWHEKPRTPEIKIEAEAHGYGWAHITLYGNIDGKPFDIDGNPNDSFHNSQSQQLGNWFSIYPIDLSSPDHTISYTEYGKFNRRPKEYKWDANGTIKMVPVYWKWSSALVAIPTGSWEEASEDYHRKTDAKSNGGWTVDRNWKTEGSRSKKLPDPEDPEENSEDSEQQGSTTPTAPGQPGSFELTPYKVAIKLGWTDATYDGGSPITDYQYQKRSSRSDRRHWSSWSDWTSAGTGNTTWITGLSKGVDYEIRMRAVNTVGNSSATGTQGVKTKE